ncbi:MAG: hypothetical protein J6J23_07575 [Clostridia bacterium]|nr:hypothetical protein [Clostridia bacterium]
MQEMNQTGILSGVVENNAFATLNTNFNRYTVRVKEDKNANVAVSRIIISTGHDPENDGTFTFTHATSDVFTFSNGRYVRTNADGTNTYLTIPQLYSTESTIRIAKNDIEYMPTINPNKTSVSSQRIIFDEYTSNDTYTTFLPNGETFTYTGVDQTASTIFILNNGDTEKPETTLAIEHRLKDNYIIYKIKSSSTELIPVTVTTNENNNEVELTNRLPEDKQSLTIKDKDGVELIKSTPFTAHKTDSTSSVVANAYVSDLLSSAVAIKYSFMGQNASLTLYKSYSYAITTDPDTDEETIKREVVGLNLLDGTKLTTIDTSTEKFKSEFKENLTSPFVYAYRTDFTQDLTKTTESNAVAGGDGITQAEMIVLLESYATALKTKYYYEIIFDQNAKPIAYRYISGVETENKKIKFDITGNPSFIYTYKPISNGQTHDGKLIFDITNTANDTFVEVTRDIYLYYDLETISYRVETTPNAFETRMNTYMTTVLGETIQGEDVLYFGQLSNFYEKLLTSPVQASLLTIGDVKDLFARATKLNSSIIRGDLIKNMMRIINTNLDLQNELMTQYARLYNELYYFHKLMGEEIANNTYYYFKPVDLSTGFNVLISQEQVTKNSTYFETSYTYTPLGGTKTEYTKNVVTIDDLNRAKVLQVITVINPDTSTSVYYVARKTDGTTALFTDYDEKTGKFGTEIPSSQLSLVLSTDTKTVTGPATSDLTGAIAGGYTYDVVYSTNGNDSTVVYRLKDKETGEILAYFTDMSKLAYQNTQDNAFHEAVLVDGVYYDKETIKVGSYSYSTDNGVTFTTAYKDNSTDIFYSSVHYDLMYDLPDDGIDEPVPVYFNPADGKIYSGRTIDKSYYYDNVTKVFAEIVEVKGEYYFKDQKQYYAYTGKAEHATVYNNELYGNSATLISAFIDKTTFRPVPYASINQFIKYNDIYFKQGRNINDAIPVDMVNYWIPETLYLVKDPENITYLTHEEERERPVYELQTKLDPVTGEPMIDPATGEEIKENVQVDTEIYYVTIYDGVDFTNEEIIYTDPDGNPDGTLLTQSLGNTLGADGKHICTTEFITRFLTSGEFKAIKDEHGFTIGYTGYDLLPSSNTVAQLMLFDEDGNLREDFRSWFDEDGKLKESVDVLTAGQPVEENGHHYYLYRLIAKESDAKADEVVTTQTINLSQFVFNPIYDGTLNIFDHKNTIILSNTTKYFDEDKLGVWDETGFIGGEGYTKLYEQSDLEFFTVKANFHSIVELHLPTSINYIIDETIFATYDNLVHTLESEVEPGEYDVYLRYNYNAMLQTYAYLDAEGVTQTARFYTLDGRFYRTDDEEPDAENFFNLVISKTYIDDLTSELGEDFALMEEVDAIFTYDADQDTPLTSSEYFNRYHGNLIQYHYTTKVGKALQEGTNLKHEYIHSNEIAGLDIYNEAFEMAVINPIYYEFEKLDLTGANVVLRENYDYKKAYRLSYNETQTICPLFTTDTKSDIYTAQNTTEKVVYDSTGNARGVDGLKVVYTFTNPISGTTHIVSKGEKIAILEKVYTFNNVGLLSEENLIEDEEINVTYYYPSGYKSGSDDIYNYLASDGSFYYYVVDETLGGIYIKSTGKVDGDVVVYDYNHLVETSYLDETTNKVYYAGVYAYNEQTGKFLNTTTSRTANFDKLYYGFSDDNTERLALTQTVTTKTYQTTGYIRTAKSAESNQQIDLLGKSIMTSTTPIIYPSFTAVQSVTQQSATNTGFLVDKSTYYKIDYSSTEITKYGLPGVKILDGAPYPNTVITFSVRHKINDQSVVYLALDIEKVFSVELANYVKMQEGTKISTEHQTYAFKDTETNIDLNNYPTEVIAITNKLNAEYLYSSDRYNLASSGIGSSSYVKDSGEVILSSRDVQTIMTYEFVNWENGQHYSDYTDSSFISKYMFYDTPMVLLGDQSQTIGTLGSGLDVYQTNVNSDNYSVEINGTTYYFTVTNNPLLNDINNVRYRETYGSEYTKYSQNCGLYYLHYATPFMSIPTNANPFDYTKVIAHNDGGSTFTVFFEKVKLTNASGDILYRNGNVSAPYYVYTNNIMNHFMPYAFDETWSADTGVTKLRELINTNFNSTNNLVDKLTQSHYRYNVIDGCWYEVVYDINLNPIYHADYNYWTSDYNKIENAGTIDIHTYQMNADGSIVLTSECSVDQICQSVQNIDKNAVTEYGQLVVSGTTSAYRTTIKSINENAKNYQGFYSALPYTIKNAYLANSSYFMIGVEEVILVTNPTITISDGLNSVVYRFKEWQAFTRYNSEVMYKNSDVTFENANSSTFTFTSNLAEYYVFYPVYERVYSVTLESRVIDGGSNQGGTITTYYKDGVRVEGDLEKIEQSSDDIHFIEYSSTGSSQTTDGKTNLTYTYEEMNIDNFIFTTEYQQFEIITGENTNKTFIVPKYVEKGAKRGYESGRLQTSVYTGTLFAHDESGYTGVSLEDVQDADGNIVKKYVAKSGVTSNAYTAVWNDETAKYELVKFTPEQFDNLTLRVQEEVLQMFKDYIPTDGRTNYFNGEDIDRNNPFYPYMVESELGRNDLNVAYTDLAYGEEISVMNVPGVNFGVTKVGKENAFTYYLYSLTDRSDKKTLYPIHYSNGRYFFLLDNDGKYYSLDNLFANLSPSAYNTISVLYDITEAGTHDIPNEYIIPNTFLTMNPEFTSSSQLFSFALTLYTETTSESVRKLLAPVFDELNNLEYFVYYMNPVTYLFNAGYSNAQISHSSAKLDRTNNAKTVKLDVQNEEFISQIYTTKNITANSDNALMTAVKTGVFFDVFASVNALSSTTVDITVEGSVLNVTIEAIPAISLNGDNYLYFNKDILRFVVRTENGDLESFDDQHATRKGSLLTLNNGNGSVYYFYITVASSTLSLEKQANGENFAREIIKEANYIEVEGNDGIDGSWYISSDTYYTGMEDKSLTQNFDRHTIIQLQAVADDGYRFEGWYFAYYNEATDEYVIMKDKNGEDIKIESSDGKSYSDEIKDVVLVGDKYQIVEDYKANGDPNFLKDANGMPETLPESIENLYAGTFLTYAKINGRLVDIEYDIETRNYYEVGNKSHIINPQAPGTDADDNDIDDILIYSYQVFKGETESTKNNYYYDFNRTFQVPSAYVNFIDNGKEYSLFSQTQFTLESNEQKYNFGTKEENGLTIYTPISAGESSGFAKDSKGRYLSKFSDGDYIKTIPSDQLVVNDDAQNIKIKDINLNEIGQIDWKQTEQSATITGRGDYNKIITLGTILNPITFGKETNDITIGLLYNDGKLYAGLTVEFFYSESGNLAMSIDFTVNKDSTISATVSFFVDQESLSERKLSAEEINAFIDQITLEGSATYRELYGGKGIADGLPSVDNNPNHKNPLGVTYVTEFNYSVSKAQITSDGSGYYYNVTCFHEILNPLGSASTKVEEVQTVTNTSIMTVTESTPIKLAYTYANYSKDKLYNADGTVLPYITALFDEHKYYTFTTGEFSLKDIGVIVKNRNGEEIDSNILYYNLDDDKLYYMTYVDDAEENTRSLALVKLNMKDDLNKTTEDENARSYQLKATINNFSTEVYMHNGKIYRICDEGAYIVDGNTLRINQLRDNIYIVAKFVESYYTLVFADNNENSTIKVENMYYFNYEDNDKAIITNADGFKINGGNGVDTVRFGNIEMEYSINGELIPKTKENVTIVKNNVESTATLYSYSVAYHKSKGEEAERGTVYCEVDQNTTQSFDAQKVSWYINYRGKYYEITKNGTGRFNLENYDFTSYMFEQNFKTQKISELANKAVITVDDIDYYAFTLTYLDGEEFNNLTAGRTAKNKTKTVYSTDPGLSLKFMAYNDSINLGQFADSNGEIITAVGNVKFLDANGNLTGFTAFADDGDGFLYYSAGEEEINIRSLVRSSGDYNVADYTYLSALNQKYAYRTGTVDGELQIKEPISERGMSIALSDKNYQPGKVLPVSYVNKGIHIDTDTTLLIVVSCNANCKISASYTTNPYYTLTPLFFPSEEFISENAKNYNTEEKYYESLYYAYLVTFNRDLDNEYSDHMTQQQRGDSIIFDTTEVDSDSFKNLYQLNDGNEFISEFGALTYEDDQKFAKDIELINANGEFEQIFTFNNYSPYIEDVLPAGITYYNKSNHSFYTTRIDNNGKAYCIGYVLGDDFNAGDVTHGFDAENFYTFVEEGRTSYNYTIAGRPIYKSFISNNADPAQLKQGFMTYGGIEFNEDAYTKMDVHTNILVQRGNVSSTNQQLKVSKSTLELYTKYTKQFREFMETVLPDMEVATLRAELDTFGGDEYYRLYLTRKLDITSEDFNSTKLATYTSATSVLNSFYTSYSDKRNAVEAGGEGSVLSSFILNTVRSLVSITNPDLRFTNVSDAIKQLFGYGNGSTPFDDEASYLECLTNAPFRNYLSTPVGNSSETLLSAKRIWNAVEVSNPDQNAELIEHCDILYEFAVYRLVELANTYFGNARLVKNSTWATKFEEKYGTAESESAYLYDLDTLNIFKNDGINGSENELTFNRIYEFAQSYLVEAKYGYEKFVNISADIGMYAEELAELLSTNPSGFRIIYNHLSENVKRTYFRNDYQNANWDTNHALTLMNKYLECYLAYTTLTEELRLISQENFSQSGALNILKFSSIVVFSLDLQSALINYKESTTDDPTTADEDESSPAGYETLTPIEYSDPNNTEEADKENFIKFYEFFAGVGRDDITVLDTDVTVEADVLYELYTTYFSKYGTDIGKMVDDKIFALNSDEYNAYKEYIYVYQKFTDNAKDLSYYNTKDEGKLYNANGQYKTMTMAIDTMFTVKAQRLDNIGAQNPLFTDLNTNGYDYTTVQLTDGNYYNIRFAGWYFSNQADTNISSDFENMTLIGDDYYSGMIAMRSNTTLIAVYRTFEYWSFTYNPSDVKVSINQTHDSFGRALTYTKNVDGTITVNGYFDTGTNIDVSVTPLAGKAFSSIENNYHKVQAYDSNGNVITETNKDGVQVPTLNPDLIADAVRFDYASEEAKNVQTVGTTIETNTSSELVNAIATRTIRMNITNLTHTKDELNNDTTKDINNFVLKTETAVIVVFKIYNSLDKDHKDVFNYYINCWKTVDPDSIINKNKIEVHADGTTNYIPGEIETTIETTDPDGNVISSSSHYKGVDEFMQSIQVSYDPSNKFYYIFGYFKEGTSVSMRAIGVNQDDFLDGWYLDGNKELTALDDNGDTVIDIKTGDLAHLAVAYYENKRATLQINTFIMNNTYDGHIEKTPFSFASVETYKDLLDDLLSGIMKESNGIALNYGPDGSRYIDGKKQEDVGNTIMLQYYGFDDETTGNYCPTNTGYPAYEYGARSVITLVAPEYVYTTEHTYKFVGWYEVGGSSAKLIATNAVWESNRLLDGRIDAVYEILPFVELVTDTEHASLSIETGKDLSASYDYTFNRIPVGITSTLIANIGPGYQLENFNFYTKDAEDNDVLAYSINMNETTPDTQVDIRPIYSNGVINTTIIWKQFRINNDPVVQERTITGLTKIEATTAKNLSINLGFSLYSTEFYDKLLYSSTIDLSTIPTYKNNINDSSYTIANGDQIEACVEFAKFYVETNELQEVIRNNIFRYNKTLENQGLTLQNPMIYYQGKTT